jgi:hypothetical protein
MPGYKKQASRNTKFQHARVLHECFHWLCSKSSQDRVTPSVWAPPQGSTHPAVVPIWLHS